MTGGLLVIGALFAGLAGLLAFLIAYEESGHHFADKRAARRLAFGTAFGAMVFFAALAVVLAFVVPQVIHP